MLYLACKGLYKKNDQVLIKALLGVFVTFLNKLFLKPTSEKRKDHSQSRDDS